MKDEDEVEDSESESESEAQVKEEEKSEKKNEKTGLTRYNYSIVVSCLLYNVHIFMYMCMCVLHMYNVHVGMYNITNTQIVSWNGMSNSSPPQDYLQVATHTHTHISDITYVCLY